MRAQRTTGAGARAPAAAATSATAPSLRRANELDARVKALRAEARTGLASNEVRRTLIKEELRPPPRPIPAPPVPSRRTAPTNIGFLSSAPSKGSSSASLGSSTAVTRPRHPSIQVETTGDSEIPAAWLTGDFRLDESSEPFTSHSPLPSSAATSSSADAAAADAASTKGTESSSVDVSRYLSYANAQRAYEALCHAAQDVVYDVPYEEKLRRVESRDGRTGLATSWTSRRTSAAAPLITNTFILNRGRTALGEEPRVQSSRGVPRTQRNASPSPYTPPSSSHGTSARHSLRSQPSLHSERLPSRDTLSAPPAVATSFVGTAVVRSSAASYATSLRQLVQTQREQNALAEQRGRLYHNFSPSSPTAAEGTEVEAEWRTRVSAALTIAVCPACEAMFEYALTSTPVVGAGEEERSEKGATKEDDGTGGALGVAKVCPHCGATVDVSAEATAATAAAHRWWLPPQPLPPQTTAAGSAATTSFDALPSSVEPTVANGAASSSGCGTDSVGFAEGDGEESFAALIARIRASKNKAAARTGSAAVHQTAPSASISMDVSGTRKSYSKGHASVGQDSGGVGPLQPSPSVPLSALAAPAPLDPMVPKLRKALNHLYFFELMKGGTNSTGNA
ncbi:hypothetical protein ABB37_10009 [Leptomonas pyrrhocoris]|uniref:Uncharacterized protein n=1 Tax=Leptomonas pyrrhocoris TaxID=157538 RepID=A0A0N0DQJ9_LEPPY|nr:hypothetical protein ABB37_10009 [Leptomonas pyrrhocoris]XP_015651752.1 hypothetical protein ABB37_10009 [Leptomonas pyrrhocoris]KPA73312.1 hypothetical protein ABB37_10009 [Leptomonas pyrrhocoris]KPA73313.1 hypothetical protein ABB37_10009 [Leptomonas pyrrhocoris]|eukprot:XP_015651751.1 hypothetical protein ABB37_10009 [Leptomonas pyrrhocoris]